MHGPSLIVADGGKIAQGITSTLPRPLILARSQVLHKLNRYEADPGQQERVNESTFVHDELQDKPGHEKK